MLTKIARVKWAHVRSGFRVKVLVRRVIKTPFKKYKGVYVYRGISDNAYENYTGGDINFELHDGGRGKKAKFIL